MGAMRVLLLCTVIATAGPVPPDPARSGPRPLLILVDSGSGLSEDLQTALRAALQREVQRSLSHHSVEPPALSLDELTLALNCDSVDEGCLRKIAENLNADSVLLAHGTDARHEVRLSWAQLRPTREFRSTGIRRLDNAATVSAVCAAARQLLGIIRPTRLAVHSEPPGAGVELDGATMGTAPLSLNDLREGKHLLRLTLGGHHPNELEVELAAGESTEVRVTMTATPATLQPQGTPATAVPAAAESIRGRLRWPLMAIGVMGGAVATVMGLAGLGLTLGGAGSWTAYWSIVRLHETNPQLVLRYNLTQPVAFAAGILSYALFFPGLGLLGLGIAGGAAGALLVLLPFFLFQ
jgi:hypothetical protein